MPFYTEKSQAKSKNNSVYLLQNPHFCGILTCIEIHEGEFITYAEY